MQHHHLHLIKTPPQQLTSSSKWFKNFSWFKRGSESKIMYCCCWWWWCCD